MAALPSASGAMDAVPVDELGNPRFPVGVFILLSCFGHVPCANWNSSMYVHMVLPDDGRLQMCRELALFLQFCHSPPLQTMA
jgi:hypothetical protein